MMAGKWGCSSVSLVEPRVVEAVLPVAAAAAADAPVDGGGDPVPPQVHGGQQPRPAPGSRVVVLPAPRYIANKLTR